MGEVYRARDTRLDRTVAMKILPAHLSTSPDARERFDREARAISSLSHPHICPLYDVGHQDGIDYLVMECLDGQTLAQRLQKRPLPIVQAIEYAIPIEDAMAATAGGDYRSAGQHHAHEIRRQLLDSGLAKLRAAKASPDSARW
jgi:serine/threonine protein kinase